MPFARSRVKRSLSRTNETRRPSGENSASSSSAGVAVRRRTCFPGIETTNSSPPPDSSSASPRGDHWYPVSRGATASFPSPKVGSSPSSSRHWRAPDAASSSQSELRASLPSPLVSRNENLSPSGSQRTSLGRVPSIGGSENIRSMVSGCWPATSGAAASTRSDSRRRMHTSRVEASQRAIIASALTRGGASRDTGACHR